jgi:hypothetical protein
MNGGAARSAATHKKQPADNVDFKFMNSPFAVTLQAGHGQPCQSSQKKENRGGLGDGTSRDIGSRNIDSPGIGALQAEIVKASGKIRVSIERVPVGQEDIIWSVGLLAEFKRVTAG